MLERVYMSDDRAIEYLSNELMIDYSDEQRKILTNNGSMCISACPGSGKTTTLGHLLLKRVLTGELGDEEDTVATTFSKAGATDINKRLVSNMASKLGMKLSLQIRTMHSSYYSVIKAVYPNVRILSDSEKMGIIHQALRSISIDKNSLYDEDLAQNIVSVLSYRVNNMLNIKDTFERKGYLLNPLDDVGLKYIAKALNEYKAEKNVIDFDDMPLLILKCMRSGAEHIKNECKRQWKNFYIDEAQDMSKLQMELLMAVEDKDSRRGDIVIIGDEDQCIYEWRGANAGTMIHLASHYELPVIGLSTNYRCGKNIIRLATNGIRHNETRFEGKKEQLAYDKNGNGVVRVSAKNSTLFKQSYLAMAQIIDYVVNCGEMEENIAVLIRNNNQAITLQLMLHAYGILYDIEEDMKAIKNKPFAEISKIAQVADRGILVDGVSTVLVNTCKYMSGKSAKAIEELYTLMGNEDLLYTLNEVSRIVEDGRMYNGNIKGDVLYKIKRNVPMSVIQSIYIMMNTLKGNGSNTKEEVFEELLKLYWENVTSFKYSTNAEERVPRSIVDMALAYVKKNKLEKLIELYKSIMQYEKAMHAFDGGKVVITTMHKAKGREWNKVILLGIDGDTFPNFQYIENAISENLSKEYINSYIEESRRLLYVASTRAKHELTIYNDIQNLSPIMLEQLGIMNENCNAAIIAMACGNWSKSMSVLGKELNNGLNYKAERYVKAFEEYLKSQENKPFSIIEEDTEGTRKDTNSTDTKTSMEEVREAIYTAINM